MDNSKGNKNHLLEGRDRESNGGNSSNRKIHNDSSAKGDESLVSAGQSKPSFRTTRWRWVALLFACFLLLGSYFWYDNPNALSDKLKDLVTHDGDNDVKYNQLYSIYSYPNVILPLFGGILIDKIGLNFSIIIFSSLLVIGQGVFTVSGFMGTEEMSDNWPYIVALAGRLIFGLGAESLGVWQSTSVGRWFRGQDLSLALGLNISVSRLGSVFNNYSMPPIANKISLGAALLFGFGLWVLSFVSGILLSFFESHAQKVDNEGSKLKEGEVEVFHWSDIKDFSNSYWIIVANCVFTYIGLFCFNNVSNDFFRKRYGFSQASAGRITSNVFLISAFLAPMFGAVADRLGHKVTFCMISGFSLTLCHALFLIIPSSTSDDKSYLGIIPIVLMGLTYSIYVAALWPMVILVVKPSVVGSAYGLWTAVQNIGLALDPLMVGALTFNNKKENSYVWVNVTLGSFAFLGFLSAVLLFIIDKSSSELRLNAPIGKEKAEEADEDKLDMDKRDPNIRNKLKRSIARSSMAR